MANEAARARGLDILAGVGASVIPVAGNVLASVFAGENLRKVQQDVTKRQDELAQRILDVEAAPAAIFSSEEGRAALMKVVDAVSLEASEEKRRMLANALLGGFCKGEGSTARGDAKRDHFMALIIAYEPEVMKTLSHTIYVEQDADGRIVRGHWVNADHAPSPHYVSRLEADGLVNTRVRALETVHDEPAVERTYCCSTLGWEFLQMVEPDFLSTKPTTSDGGAGFASD